MIVLNTSPLILLGKISRLSFLQKLFGKVIISKEVYKEILSKPLSDEAAILKKAVEEKWIKVERTSVKVHLTGTIGKGELSSIELAVKYKLPLIIDDKKAAFIAETFNLKCHGTLYVILLGIKKGIIKKKEAVEILDQLIDKGLYIGSDVLAEFYSLLDRIKG